MKDKKFCVKYSKDSKLLGQCFDKLETAEKYLPFYKEKGWKEAVIEEIEVDITPLTEEEKKDLALCSKFLKKITGR